jgi:hypothetical protein
MADRKETVIPPVDGETRFNTGSVGTEGALYAGSTGGANQGSVLALDGISSAGVVTTWYFFVTSAGVLRVSSTYPTNTETGGSAV